MPRWAAIVTFVVLAGGALGLVLGVNLGCGLASGASAPRCDRGWLLALSALGWPCLYGLALSRPAIRDDPVRASGAFVVAAAGVGLMALLWLPVNG